MNNHKIRRGDAEVAYNTLGHAFMKGERKNERIGKGVRDVIDIKDGWHLGFPAKPLHAFGNVKDYVPSVAVCQPFDK